MTLDQPPRQGFDPQNQPWRQWVERGILSLSKRLEQKFGNDVANSFLATASSLKLLSAQVQEVQNQADRLDAAVTQLEATAATVDDLYALQIDIGTASASGNNFAMSTGYAVKASGIITIPAGFTRADVFCGGSVTGASDSTTGDQLFGFVTINGNNGPAMSVVMTTQERGSALAAFHSVSLSGLTPGGTISYSISARLTIGPNSAIFQSFNSASISAQATFRR